MSEWRNYKLGEITDWFSGGTPSKGNANYWQGSIPWVSAKSMTVYKISDSELKISAEALKKGSRLAQVNDILLLVRGSGLFIDIPLCWVEKPVAFNQDIKAIRAKSPDNQEYLYFWLYGNKQRLRDILEETGIGAGKLDTELLRGLEVSMPTDRTEKAKIVSTARSLFEKIDLLHRQNATLEAMAETLFRQWFVESEYDRTVGDLVSVESGYAFKSKDFREMGSYRVLKIKNISNGLVDTTNTDFVDEEVGAKVQEKFKVVAGDILIAMTGAEIGKLGIVPGTNERLLLNQRVGLLRERYSGSGYLAYIQLKSEFGRDYIDNAATGSAQPNISAGAIQRCPFPDVSDAKLKNYSSQLSPVYAKLVFNLGQIRTLQAIRDALLPRLMSGEITIL